MVMLFKQIRFWSVFWARAFEYKLILVDCVLSLSFVYLRPLSELNSSCTILMGHGRFRTPELLILGQALYNLTTKQSITGGLNLQWPIVILQLEFDSESGQRFTNDKMSTHNQSIIIFFFNKTACFFYIAIYEKCLIR